MSGFMRHWVQSSKNVLLLRALQAPAFPGESLTQTRRRARGRTGEKAAGAARRSGSLQRNDALSWCLDVRRCPQDAFHNACGHEKTPAVAECLVGV
ncbi:unnamed protein product [Caretta caretta]